MTRSYKSSNDILDEFNERINSLERLAKRIDNRFTVRVPEFSIDVPPNDATQNEIRIDAGSQSIYWYQEPIWKTVSGGAGIMFDVDNQGGWLKVETNDIQPPPPPYTDGAGTAIYIGDASSGYIGSTEIGGGITIEAWGNLPWRPGVTSGARKYNNLSINAGVRINSSGYAAYYTGGRIEITANIGPVDAVPTEVQAGTGEANINADAEIGFYTWANAYKGPGVPPDNYFPNSSGDIGAYASRDFGVYTDRDTALYSSRDLYLQAGLANYPVYAGGDIFMQARGGSYTVGEINIYADATLDMASGTTSPVWITFGTVFEIYGLSGILFRVAADGSLHGKSGKSLVFDL